MKTSRQAAMSAAVLAMCTLAPTRGHAAKPGTAEAIPSSPVGVMSAYPTVVQTGTKPTLNWSILHPSTISDIVTVNPPGTLIPDEDVYATVQIVGNEPTACVPGEVTTPASTDARVSYNGGSYVQLFYGTPDDVNPSSRLYIKKMKAYDTLDFGGRYVRLGSSAWSPFYTTRSANLQVIALVDGDVPPTYSPLYNSPTLAEYLKPYLDASGKVSIGPLSVLILMELGSTDHTENCFDYQDQVLLVTFSKKHPNNGHGNNLDGVDVSNPGQGHGGPNGEIDPSGGIDDEIK